jgi:rhamnosyltransferase
VRDPRDRQELPFVRLGWLRNRHCRCCDGAGLIACDFLISSGALIGTAAIDAVGGFDESLFVDSVDLEWSFRARSMGFALYGVCGAVLDHRLGDERKAVWKGVHLVVHSPQRTYYMTRNRFLLYRRGYMPLKWKWKDLLRATGKFTATMLLVAPRREYAGMTLRGIRDALTRRDGSIHGPDAR